MQHTRNHDHPTLAAQKRQATQAGKAKAAGLDQPLPMPAIPPVIRGKTADGQTEQKGA